MVEQISETLPRGLSVMSRGEIVRWWERRRFRYNILIGAVGFTTWCLVLIAGSAAVKPGVDFEEPMVMLIGPILYGIAANLFYTLGWIVDICFYRGYPRSSLFRIGLTFSLVLTSLPGLWAVTAWLMAVITGKKLA